MRLYRIYGKIGRYFMKLEHDALIAKWKKGSSKAGGNNMTAAEVEQRMANIMPEFGAMLEIEEKILSLGAFGGLPQRPLSSTGSEHGISTPEVEGSSPSVATKEKSNLLTIRPTLISEEGLEKLGYERERK